MKRRVPEICPHVYQVGGDNLSRGEDCCVYLVESSGQGAIIDTGAGASADDILDNIEYSGFKLAEIRHIIITHGHIDHIGGVKTFKDRLKAEVIAHRLDLAAIEEGRPELTAAPYYGVQYEGVKVDKVLTGDDKLELGELTLSLVHTPGHTPGSISVYADIQGQRVLFGQDIHGPFAPEWGSDRKEWARSMRKLLDLEADILCEGHFGIYSPAGEVREYIEGYLRRFRG